MAGVLERLGLHRPALRAWALYDWANSAFVTVIITAVFPPYFQHVADGSLDGPVATSRYAWATTVALAAVAVLAPILGAVADHAPVKKKLLATFLGLGVGATAALFFVHEGDWVLGLVAFGLANVGVAGSFVFYDALLPHIASAEEVDRVSTAGYALGYLGGGVILAGCLAIIQMPEIVGLSDAGAASRVSFLAVAVWWVLFSIPLFRRVPEPAVRLARPPDRRVLGQALKGLLATLRELRRFRSAFVMMIAFLVYNDGIQTIIRMAAIYGAEIGIDRGTLIAAILVVQLVGIPCTFAFGQLAAWIGPKRAVLVAVAVYGVIALVGWRMDSAAEFWVLAILVGLVQGGAQALSRSLFASLIPKAKSSELFGLFAVFEKFAGIFGPAVFGLAVSLTGSSRDAILSVIAFFVVGGLLLSRVDVEAGRAAARAADAEALRAER
ncbi:MAG TPA: MFS transporter [Sandaracinaceae bacterium LLY-WYZ-13_1]|nr:MFS transporter [Sandaracinaceae bacterium LLY-WYZ-13_1]